MTKFEQIGVNRQYDADNIKESNTAFARSCECCCSKGMKLDCTQCAIAYVHNLVVAYFNDKGVCNNEEH